MCVSHEVLYVVYCEFVMLGCVWGCHKAYLDIRESSGDGARVNESFQPVNIRRHLPLFSPLSAAVIVVFSLSVFLTTSCRKSSTETDEGIVLNIGHFPNVTHVQGLVAHHMSRLGKGWFEERLEERFGKPVQINWYTYNAGPGAMEAVFARSIDLTYVGPSPAINAYARSGGSEIRLLSGAVEGGSVLVIPQQSNLKSPSDFKGKVIATPQLGNTQDVACRAWLAKGGLRVTQTGGDAKIMPTANPEQMSLFRQGKLDAVWTVEPWVSRLEMQAQGKPLVDDRESVTTVLASSSEFVNSQPELARAVLAAHRQLTEWINANPEEARKMVVAELEALTRSKIDPALVESSWKRIVVTNELPLSKLEAFVNDARQAGFLKDNFDVSGMIAILPDEKGKSTDKGE